MAAGLKTPCPRQDKLKSLTASYTICYDKTLPQQREQKDSTILIMLLTAPKVR